MIKYAKVINEELGLVEVGLGTNTNFYVKIGMTEMDVDLSDIDNQWYLSEKCPHKSDIEKLQEAKQNKYKENDDKAEQSRTSKEFIIIIQDKECLFDTKPQTQIDLLTAFAVCSQGLTYDGWVTNNGVILNLTLEDLINISNKFKELSDVYPLWNYYRKAIEDAKTVKEVEDIVIDYNINIIEPITEDKN